MTEADDAWAEDFAAVRLVLRPPATPSASPTVSSRILVVIDAHLVASMFCVNRQIVGLPGFANSRSRQRP